MHDKTVIMAVYSVGFRSAFHATIFEQQGKNVHLLRRFFFAERQEKWKEYL